MGGVPRQVSCHVSSEAPARLSYLGFPHYLKVEGSYDTFRKPKWKEDAITLGYILLMAAQNKLRWRTDAHGHSSKLWRLILRYRVWIPGRSLVVSLLLPGVRTASVMAWCKTNAHNFCFSPFFHKSGNPIDFFQLAKTGTYVDLSEKQSVRQTFEKQRIPVLWTHIKTTTNTI